MHGRSRPSVSLRTPSTAPCASAGRPRRSCGGGSVSCGDRGLTGLQRAGSCPRWHAAATHASSGRSSTWCGRAGLPRPTCQRIVRAHGRFVARTDFTFEVTPLLDLRGRRPRDPRHPPPTPSATSSGAPSYNCSARPCAHVHLRGRHRAARAGCSMCSPPWASIASRRPRQHIERSPLVSMTGSPVGEVGAD